MKVVAVKSRADSIYAGYDGEKRRRHGEVFDWPDGKKLASWMRPEGTKIDEPEDGIGNAEKIAVQSMTLKQAATPLELPTAPKKRKGH